MTGTNGDNLDTPAARRPRVPILLTPRDYAIFRSLFDSRVLTAAQLAEVHFAGSRGAAKQRLWTLTRAGFLAGRFGTPAGLPLPLRLTRRGFEELQASGHLCDYPRVTWQTMSKRFKVASSTLAHELDVGSVKAVFFRAARENPSWQVSLAVTWPRLLRFRVRPNHHTHPLVVSPDGFLRLLHTDAVDTTRQVDLFLEVDRATETLSRIVERSHGYMEYFASGGYSKRQGQPDAQPSDFPFRVCWVFPTKLRLESFLRGCIGHVRPIRKMVWAAVMADVLRDPLGPVWRRPIDSDAERQALV